VDYSTDAAAADDAIVIRHALWSEDEYTLDDAAAQSSAALEQEFGPGMLALARMVDPEAYADELHDTLRPQLAWGGMDIGLPDDFAKQERFALLLAELFARASSAGVSITPQMLNCARRCRKRSSSVESVRGTGDAQVALLAGTDGAVFSSADFKPAEESIAPEERMSWTEWLLQPLAYLKRLAKHFDVIGTVCSQLLSVVEGFTSKMAAAKRYLVDKAGIIGLGFGLCLVAVLLVRRKVLPMMLDIVTGFFAMLPPVGRIFSDLKEWIAGALGIVQEQVSSETIVPSDDAMPDYSVRPQAGGVGTFGGLVAACMVFLVPLRMQKSALAVALQTVPKLSSGVDTVVGGLEWIASRLPDFMQRFLVGVGLLRPLGRLDAMERSAVSRLVGAMSVLDCDGNTWQSDKAFLDNFMIDHAAYHKVWAASLVAPETATTVYLTKLSTRVAAAHKRVRSAMLSKARIAPIGILLFGISGVGKSEVSNALAAIAAGGDASRIYSRQKDSKDKYWSGWNPHKDILLYSDWGSLLSQSDLLESMREFLPMMSSEAFYVNMADLPDKGQTAEPSTVIINTNVPIRASMGGGISVVNFLRRFITYRVTLLPEYDNNGMADVAKLQKMTPQEAATFPHLLFQPVVLGSDVGAPIAFPEVALRVQVALRARAQSGAFNNTMMHEAIQRYVSPAIELVPQMATGAPLKSEVPAAEEVKVSEPAALPYAAVLKPNLAAALAEQAGGAGEKLVREFYGPDRSALQDFGKRPPNSAGKSYTVKIVAGSYGADQWEQRARFSAARLTWDQQTYIPFGCVPLHVNTKLYTLFVETGAFYASQDKLLLKEYSAQLKGEYPIRPFYRWLRTKNFSEEIGRRLAQSWKLGVYRAIAIDWDPADAGAALVKVTDPSVTGSSLKAKALAVLQPLANALPSGGAGAAAGRRASTDSADSEVSIASSAEADNAAAMARDELGSNVELPVHRIVSVAVGLSSEVVPLAFAALTPPRGPPATLDVPNKALEVEAGVAKCAVTAEASSFLDYGAIMWYGALAAGILAAGVALYRLVHGSSADEAEVVDVDPQNAYKRDRRRNKRRDEFEMNRWEADELRREEQLRFEIDDAEVGDERYTMGGRARHGGRAQNRISAQAARENALLSGNVMPQALLDDALGERNDNAALAVRRSVERVTQNMVRLLRSNPDGTVASLNGVVLSERTMSTVYHFFTCGKNLLPTGTPFTVRYSNCSFTEKFDPERLKVVDVMSVSGETMCSDMVTYILSNAVPSRPSIVNLLASSADLGSLSQVSTSYMLFGPGRPDGKRSVHAGTPILRQHNVRWRSAPGGVGLFAHKTIAYDLFNGGDCGGVLLVILEGNLKIVSMHVAEMHDNRVQVKSGMGVPFIGLTLDSVTVQGAVETLDPEVFTYVGVEDQGTQMVGRRSTFAPSLIADSPLLAAVDVEPSLLGYAGDSRCDLTPEDLAIKELNLGVGVQLDLPAPQVAEAMRWVTEHLLSNSVMRNAPRRVLTEEEAINGDCPGLRPLAMGTSAGFGYPGTKRPLFARETEAHPYAVISTKLRSELDEMEATLRAGRRAEVIFIAALKGELRSAAKIAQRRSRVIMISPTAFTIMCRRYTGSFVGAMGRMYGKSSHALGINPYSAQWQELMAYLNETSDKGFDGDIKKLEALWGRKVSDLVLDVVEEFYGPGDPGDRAARAMIFDHITNTDFMLGKLRFIQNGGVPSGVYGTTVWDFFVTFLLVSVSYLLLAARHSPEDASMAAFGRLVRVVIYGDDNVVAPAPRIAWFYNQTTVSRVLAEHNVEFTAADKVSALSTVKPLIDCVFLKNTTNLASHVPGVRLYAYQSRADVLKSLKFVSKKLDPERALIQNMNDGLRRHFGAPRADFEKLRSDFVAALAEAGVYSPLLTHEACAAYYGLEVGPVLEEEDFDPSETWLPSRESKLRGYHRYLATRPADDLLPIEDILIMSQMEVAPGEARGNLVDPKEELGFGNQKRLIDDEGWYAPDMTIEALCKRPGVWLTDVPAGRRVFSLASILHKFEDHSCGTVYWYGRAFAFYRGGFVITTYTTSFARVGFVPEIFNNYVVMFDGNFVGTGNLGVGPIALGEPQSGYVETKIPFVSQFHFLQVPRRASEYSFAKFSLGRFMLQSTINPGLTNVFAAADDGFKFARLREVPRLSPKPIPVLEEKDALDGDIVIVPQMDRGAVGLVFDDANLAAEARASSVAAPPPVQLNQDPEMSMAMLAMRPQLLTSGNWIAGGTQPANTVLFSAELPWEAIAGQATVPFKNYTFWNGDVTLRLTAQSQPFQQGMLIMYFVPGATRVEALAHITTSRTSQSILPHVCGLAGRTIDMSLRVPFVSTYGRFAMKEFSRQILGTIFVSVFNELVVGPAAIGSQQTVPWSLYASFPDSHFETLDPASALVLPERSFPVPAVQVFPQGGVQSAMAQMKNVTAAVRQTVDIADRVRDAAAGATFDRPNIGVSPMPVIRKPAPDMATLDNVTYAQELGVGGPTVMIDARHFGDMPDSTQLYTLAKMMSYFGTARWDVAAPEGTVLAQDYICPAPKILTAVGEYQPSLLEYISLPHSFWAGGLKIRVEVVSTAGFQTGRLALVARYQKDLGPVPLDQALAQYAVIIDVGGSGTVVDVDLPWRSVSDRLRVPSRRGLPLPEYVTGVWQLVVVTPLATSENIAGTVEVNLYLGAGEDFRLCHLGFNTREVEPVDPYTAL
jgi:hypothetical protein